MSAEIPFFQHWKSKIYLYQTRFTSETITYNSYLITSITGSNESLKCDIKYNFNVLFVLKLIHGIFEQGIVDRLAKNRELDFESVQIKPNLKCNYPSPIDLDANGILFGKKLFRK